MLTLNKSFILEKIAIIRRSIGEQCGHQWIKPYRYIFLPHQSHALGSWGCTPSNRWSVQAD